jgi:hypothetical protein
VRNIKNNTSKGFEIQPIGDLCIATGVYYYFLIRIFCFRKTILIAASKKLFLAIGKWNTYFLCKENKKSLW